MSLPVKSQKLALLLTASIWSSSCSTLCMSLIDNSLRIERAAAVSGLFTLSSDPGYAGIFLPVSRCFFCLCEPFLILVGLPFAYKASMCASARVERMPSWRILTCAACCIRAQCSGLLLSSTLRNSRTVAVSRRSSACAGMLTSTS